MENIYNILSELDGNKEIYTIFTCLGISFGIMIARIYHLKAKELKNKKNQRCMCELERAMLGNRMN